MSMSLTEDKLEEELKKTDPNVKENKIILLTVLNPVYRLNVDIIQRICKSNGKVRNKIRSKSQSVSTPCPVTKIDR